MDRTNTHSGRPQVIDIVVVAYRNDIFLLKAQARSIELYIDHNRVANIYVCVNDDDEYCNMVNTNWWGKLKDRVHVIPRSRFGVANNLTGWESQQLYKLCLANQAKSTWSMCLDSKTWFINQLDWNLLFNDEGKANFSSFPTIPVFAPAQEFVEKYFNIRSPLVIGPGGVPFMFHTETVKDMFDEIPDFFNFFCTHSKYPDLVTEFMLYSGYVVKKYGDHNSLYSQHQYYSFCNIADWQIPEFETAWNLTENENLLTISIQERAYPHLNDEQFYRWIAFLQSRFVLLPGDTLIHQLNTLR